MPTPSRSPPQQEDLPPTMPTSVQVQILPSVRLHTLCPGSILLFFQELLGDDPSDEGILVPADLLGCGGRCDCTLHATAGGRQMTRKFNAHVCECVCLCERVK